MRDRTETPIRRQYERLRAQHPGCLLLFQLGDFFESFEEDARTLARACAVTLTSRELGKGDRVALAGIPITRLEHYLARLVEAGVHVAIAEQTGTAGAGLVEREVTRVVTPGTLAEPGLLRERENNYLVALARGRSGIGLAYADVTTGEFAVTQLEGDEAEARLRFELERLGPAEVLVPEGQDVPSFGRMKGSSRSPHPGPPRATRERVPGGDPLPEGQAKGPEGEGPRREGEGSRQSGGVHVTVCQPWRFAEEAARERLCRQLGVLSLEGFGCAGMPLAVGAAGALLSYLEETNRRLVASLARLRTYTTGRGMPLDAQTRRNLELTRNARSGRMDGSLLGVLDRTRTPMGGRMLRRWLGEPRLDVDEIERRLDAVERLVGEERIRARARELLGRIGDLERQVGRVAQGLASARELLNLADGLRTAARVGEVARELDRTEARTLPETGVPDFLRQDRPGGAVSTVSTASGEPEEAETGRGRPSARGPYLAELARLDPCPDVAELIGRAVQISDGRRIRPGYCGELDELVESVQRARRWMAGLETTERRRTGIKSLKVGYNRLFGYYIEVTRPNLKLVPEDYQRKQTLAGAERFATPALREREALIVQTGDRIAQLDQELYDRLLGQVAAQGARLRRLGRDLARLDVFASLADLAHERGYRRPLVDEGEELEILDGRHPVVEAGLEPGSYIPNDCQLSTAGCQVAILTGPNMAGKSTYLRQVALIVLMAQIGSFVPAGSARIGLVDRIFTRVGAQDDIAAGASTFMVEMMETAAILRQASSRSLIVLDEIGRGTSTFDGLSIARAVVEEVHQRLGARTLFATHFHEIARLETELPRVRVFNAAVAEEGGELVFLRRIVPGGASRSFGIQVARLAGLPASVTERAEQILKELEAGSANGHAEGAWADGPTQLALDGFETTGSDAGILGLLGELRRMDVWQMTPGEAIVKLAELRRLAGAG
ncbi:MAG TPA: DNA mismatch repair protein MutS [Chloroflexota bacterium]